MPIRRARFVLSTLPALCALLAIPALAQPKPGPDTLTLTDGEKLLGHLKSATGASVVFHSDMLGDITVDWAKIQELRSSAQFAVIPKGVKITRPSDADGHVPRGVLSVADQKVEVTQAPTAQPQTVPISNVGSVVELPAFENALHPRNFFKGWKGAATAGASLTEATQDSHTFAASINMVRAMPSESWLDLRNRTIFDFNEAYGKLTQPGTPTVKTSLLHIDIEQDRYVSPRIFAFVNAALDHSFSQGLDLQQTYGGGIGVVVLKSPNQELDAKASANYIRQQFQVGDNSQSLIGSVFSETYTRKLPFAIQLKEQGGFTPAWNNTNAWSAFSSFALTLPTYHHIGVTFGVLDNYLNDPPVSFKKNSFQATVGATYAIQ